MRRIPIARSIREALIGISAVSNSPLKSVIRNVEIAKISHVLDVGANVGQTGIDFRRHGFKGQIVSFEPVSETFTLLTETIKKYQPWSAYQLALGSSESPQRIINISGNSGLSSSLLTMDSVHELNFPESVPVAAEKVSMSTLDRQLGFLRLDPEKILLKLDVQGYESEVLKGASNSLSKIPLCFLEVSLVPLYEGETTLLPILNLLAESGHEVIDVFRGIKAKNGQLLQLDILTKRISN